jgi:hypothetical protein
METLKDFKTGVFAPITYTSTSHAAPTASILAKMEGEKFVMFRDFVAPRN